MQISFYQSDRGENYVGDFIRNLDDKTKNIIQTKLETWEKYDVRTDFKKLKGYRDLYQIRIGAFRTLCTFSGDICCLLHIFRKTSNETPKKELTIASNRAKKFKQFKLS